MTTNDKLDMAVDAAEILTETFVSIGRIAEIATRAIESLVVERKRWEEATARWRDKDPR